MKNKKNKKEVQNQWDSCQKPNSLKKSIEVHFYCIFTTHLMSICEKKIWQIHAEKWLYRISSLY